MVLVTTENKVYSMREQLFSARRPRPDLHKPEESWLEAAAKEAQALDVEEEEDLQAAIKSTAYPVYDAVLTQMD